MTRAVLTFSLAAVLAGLGPGLELMAQTVSRAGANGALRVSATVVGSVSVVFGPDGTQRVVVANAPDEAALLAAGRQEFKQKTATSKPGNPGLFQNPEKIRAAGRVAALHK